MGHDVAKSAAPGKPDEARETAARSVPAEAGSPAVPAGRSLWPRPGQVDLTGDILGPEAGPATEIRAREWGLVLTARGIPHALRRQGRGWRLYVPRRRAAEALAEIGAYADERANRPLPDPGAEPPRPPVWPEVLAVVGLLTAVFGLLLGDFAGLPWREIGAGDSTAMLGGQWWRAVTALTLHADPAHLLGNAACGALFLCLLCRETGLGLGFGLCLAAGVGGNLVKVAVQGPGMHFLGASTAVFGALGVLGGVRLLAWRGQPRIGRAVTAGAVFMLLAMLGAGTEDGRPVDLAGHLFGFACGGVLGLAAGWRVERRGRPGPVIQLLSGGAALAGLVAAWAWPLVR